MSDINKKIEKYSPWVYFFIVTVFVIITAYLGLLDIIPILLVIFGVYYAAFQKIEWKKSSKALLNELKKDYESEVKEWLSGNDYILPEIIIKSKRYSDHIQSTYKEKNNNKPINLNQIIEYNEDFIVVGESGIGKTSLLYWIGLQLSERNIESKYIPLIISLKEISDKSTKDEFISLLQTRYNINNYNLSGKHLLFLLDGLDQLNNYENVKKTLKHKDIFAAFDKDYKIIITTRLTGYEKVKSDFKDQYEYLEIQPFDNEKIKKYLGEEYYNDSKFQELFSINKELIKIPILLKLIKKLISENELDNIESKADLYGKFIEYLLGKWQKNKEGNISADFNSVDIKNDLIDISYRSLENHQLGSIPFENAIKYLNNNENKINRLISWCVTHDLVEKGEKSNFIYTHQSFQEYFASKKLKKEIFKNSKVNDSIIKKKLEYFIWDEVWLFLIGSFPPEKAKEIIGIIAYCDLFLAARCIEEYKGEKKDFKDVVNQLVEKLNEEQKDVKVSIAEAIVKIGTMDDLLFLLKNKDIDIQNIATNAIGKIGITDDLLLLLKDDYTDIRSNAARAIGKIGTKENVQDILPILECDEWNVQWSAIEAIVRIGTNEDLLPLLEGNDVRVRQSAARAIGKFGANENVEDLLPLLEDNDVRVRQSTATAIGILGAEENVKDLLPLLEDDNLRVRQSAAKAIGKIGTKNNVQDILPLLKNSKQFVRSIAAQTIGKIGTTEDLVPLLGNNEFKIRRNAVKAMGKFGSRENVQDILHLLNDNEPLVRSSTIKAISRIGTKENVQDIIFLLKDDDVRVRQSAVKAIGKMGAKKNVQDIISLFEDDDVRVRQSATRAIGLLGANENVEDLLPLLKNDHVHVQRSAARAIRIIGTNENVEDLLPLLKDNKWFVRDSAARAIGIIGTNENVEDLLPLLKDNKEEVWFSAADAIGKISSQLVFKRDEVKEQKEQQDKIVRTILNLNENDPKIQYEKAIEEIKKATGRRFVNILYDCNYDMK